jgi:hypothetical protein
VNDAGRRLSNHRDWREYLSTAQAAVVYPYSVAYPKVVDALRSGGAWLTEFASRKRPAPAADEAFVPDEDPIRP